MNDYTDILLNAQTLIRFPSITPNDHGCHQWLMNALDQYGYQCQIIEHDGVSNLLGIPPHGLNTETLLFVGHSDVVPVSKQNWQLDPFGGIIDADELIGRGAVDMKSSIAAMLTAVAQLHNQQQRANIAFLITSNEEGDSNFGIEYVLKHHRECIDPVKYVLIGEPTSVHSIGDTIKVGRRGSLNLTLHVEGLSQHVAYAKREDNVVDLMHTLTHALNQHTWGESFPHFQDTQMTLVSINATSDVFNVTSATCSAKINWRYNPSLTQQSIIDQTNAFISALKRSSCQISTRWYAVAQPFYAKQFDLAEKIAHCIQLETSVTPELSTSGGTSDARFFDPAHHQVVELGPRHALAHQPNERIHLTELKQLRDIYLRIAKSFIVNIESPSIIA